VRGEVTGMRRAAGLLVLDAITAPHNVFFGILLVAFAVLATERIRNDLVAVLIILSLAAAGLLSPKEAVAGFSSEPAIVVVSVFVLSAALHFTGVSETLGHGVGRLAGGGYARAVGVMMSAVALLSAVTHHVTMTAVMLPVTLDLANRQRVPPSKLLIPLSFAASLGTTITIIGAPAFLVASAVLKEVGRPGLGIFALAPIGLAISALGTLYMMTVGRLLLPERRGSAAGAERFELDRYFTEVAILADSPFADRTIADLENDARYRFKVVGVVRDGRRAPEPLHDRTLSEGDVLLVRAAPEDLIAFRQEAGLELHPVHQYERTTTTKTKDKDDDDAEVAERLVQAIIAPGSDLVGRTLAETEFRRRYDVIVVGLWRKDGWLEEELSRIPLRGGDVLVLRGDEDALARVATDPRFLMMVPFHGQPRPRRKAPLAALIMAGTVAAASIGIPLELAGMAGALAMVLTRCLTAGQAYRAIDGRIFVFIAGAIPLGTAMKNSGASDLIAGWLEGALQGWSPFLVLLVLYAVVAVVTEFMSDAATTALLAPLAAALAQGLGHPPEPYVATVALASVTAFLTPMAHHGNLVVYGPGGYRFGDFARVGTPLTILIAITIAAIAPLLWE
jgi:di/tricarboxylate transporter